MTPVALPPTLSAPPLPRPGLTIMQQLALAFGSVLVAATGLVLVALAALGQAEHSLESLANTDWRKASAAASVEALTRANAQATMELFVLDDPAAQQAALDRIAGNRAAVDAALATLDQLVSHPEARAALNALKVERAGYVKSFERLQQLLRAGRRTAATDTLTQETLPMLVALQTQVHTLAQLQQRLAEDLAAAAIARSHSARQQLIALAVVALLLALVGTVWLVRSIARPIVGAVALTEQVARGRLGNRIDTRGGGEVGRLARALARMDRQLVDVVSRVRHASDSVSDGSAQIAAGAIDLSSRTEEQAASLQETASSMEELASTMRQNAERACSARDQSQAASGAASEGTRLVHLLGETMTRLLEGSRQIGRIIGLVDDIAFQTNILALNASVEAARAGEHGRGFAVVADEVRGLAQDSASAARDIKKLVQANLALVGSGHEQMVSIVGTIDDLRQRADLVRDTISHISEASVEQSRGIEQVNTALAQLDQVTQHNAALVEESAAASAGLRHQAERLVDVVRSFHIDRSACAAPDGSVALPAPAVLGT